MVLDHLIKKKSMRIVIYTILLFCFLQEFQAQDTSGYRIIRSSVGSAGSSQNIVTNKGTYNVSQSIGQGSVIGTHSSKGYFLRQGYQQPFSKVKIVKPSDNSIQAKVYPNPFKQSVTVTFNTNILEDMSVLIVDVNGKVIYKQNFLPAMSIELKVNAISNGIYFLRVASGGNYFNEKLIKI